MAACTWVDRWPHPATLVWWALVLAVAVAIKAHYRLATANELQWMLAPLATLVEWLTPYTFERLASGAYLNTQHDIAIVKACAGVNFMVMSLLVIASHSDPAREGGEGRVMAYLKRLGWCVLLSWVVALGVNSVRIVLVMQMAIHEIVVPGLSGDGLHRLVGILVFFPALWGQAVLQEQEDKKGRGYGRAAMVYLGVLVGVPFLTGGWMDEGFWGVVWVVGVVVGLCWMLFLFGLSFWRRLMCKN